jgi:hypothetical protein
MSTTISSSSPDYSAEDIAKLAPGPELDLIVHTKVFKQPPPIGTRRRVPKYSIDVELIAPAVASIPFAFGQSSPGSPFYSDEKKYWAGNQQLDIVFVSNSPALAACKAAVYIAQLVEKRGASQNVAE